jgi:ATP-dependent Clp protease adaptor protein ClpS
MFPIMVATKIKRSESTKTGRKARTEPPYNVLLHNEWDNAFQRVIFALRRAIPGMTFKKATIITYTAHSTGQALVKSCHKELAELYRERMLAEGLTATIEPAK